MPTAEVENERKVTNAVCCSRGDAFVAVLATVGQSWTGNTTPSETQPKLEITHFKNVFCIF